MKKFIALLLSFALILTLAACGGIKPELPTQPATEPTEPTQPTTEPTEPIPQTPANIRQGYPVSKENVPEFVELYNKNVANYNKISEMDCNNITPPGVFEETGVRIFEVQLARFYFAFDDVFVQGSSIPYRWLTSAVTYDCDGDGVKELIYSYHHGTAWYSGSIEVFNTVSQKRTFIYTERMTTGVTDSLYITKSEDDSEALFRVWRVKWKPDYQTTEYNGQATNILLGVEYEFVEFAGNLKMVDGSLQFVPYAGK